MALLALFTTAVSNLYESGSLQLSGAFNFTIFLLKSVTWPFLFAAGWALIRRFDHLACVAPAGKRRWNAREILMYTAILSAAWLPYLIIFRPGTLGMDTVNQLWDFYSGSTPLPFSWMDGQALVKCFLNNHHPVFDTLVFAGFVNLGRAINGTNELGILLYCLLQLIGTAAACAVMLCSFERFGIPQKYRHLGLWALCLIPIFPFYAITMIKDSLFDIFFILYMVCFAMIIHKGAERRDLIWLLVLSVLLSLTKKTGIYIVLLSGIFLVLLPSVRKHLVSWILSLAVPALLLFVLLPKVIFPAFDIYPGGPQEVYGILFQMVARAQKEDPSALTKEQYEIVDQVIDADQMTDVYEYHSADAVKNTYRFESATTKDLHNFFGVWLKVGLRHPGAYLRALGGTCGAYFTPSSYRMYLYNTWNPYDANKFAVRNPDSTLDLRNGVNEWVKWLSGVPVLGLLLSLCLYAWWIPLLAFARSVALGIYKNLLVLLPVFVTTLTLIAGPTVGTRYAMGIAFTCPLLLALGSRGVSDHLRLESRIQHREEKRTARRSRKTKAAPQPDSAPLPEPSEEQLHEILPEE